MSEKKWTIEQQNVIDARDCNLLVSAAAGSGKTAVLVQRIIEKVTDKKHPMDIDRLLVVTFTKAAAREMKERIRIAIAKAAEADPGNSHLEIQMTLVHNARITTIDSFCTNLVRDNFHKIDLEPDFRIGDEGEMKLLRQDVLDEVFDALYEEGDEGFLNLVRCYGSKNRDTALQEMIQKLYTTSQSYPWPNKWLDEILETYRVSDEKELTESSWMQWFLELQKTRIKDLKIQAEKALAIANLPDGPATYLPALEADLSMLEALCKCQTYEELQVMFSNLKFVTLGRKKCPNEDLKNRAQNIRKAYKKALEDIAGVFTADLSDTLQEMQRQFPVMETLVKVCRRFENCFTETKRRKNVLDFNDIEHMALMLLREEDGTLKDTAFELQQQFEEVCVDEYQDSNYLQEAILTAVSKNDVGGHNMFMVGDVKQSIYSFRQARPDLFMDKMNRYDLLSGEADALSKLASSDCRIDLAKNFRSRSEVLLPTNDIFYRIMQQDLGNVPYDDNVALYVGNTGYGMPEDASEDPYALEVLLADSDPQLLEEAELDSKVSLEAKIVGDKIRELKKTLLVTDADTNELRPARWGDMVILMRSPASNGVGEAYVESLMEQGIPAHLTSSEGYFDTTEVSVALALLSVINNQMQDIPLLAVMHSFIGGFSNGDAMCIRGSYKEKQTFHECYQAICDYLVNENVSEEDSGSEVTSDSEAVIPKEPEMEISSELKNKILSFREFLAHARKRAEDVPIHVLIAELLEETGYLDYVTGLPGGAVRRANLQKLVDQAIAFESTSYRGLSRFMKYIEKLRKYEVDFGSAELIGEEDDAVRIISIHKSKGLEYPVVFLSGCGKFFNEGDARGSMVIQSRFGVALDAVDPELRTKQKTVYKSTLENVIRSEMLGEELRILYVALTRAKEKLIITGCLKGAEDKISAIRESTLGLPKKQSLSFSDRFKARTYLDWILPALLSYGEDYVSAISVVQPKADEETEEEIASIAKQQEDLLTLPVTADISMVEEIAKRLEYVYPYDTESHLKAKYSVSELKHMAMEKSMEDAPELPVFRKKEHEPFIPSFIAEDMTAEEDVSEAGEEKSKPKVSGARRGTAMHRALECMDFARQDFASSLSEQLKRMGALGQLSEEQLKLINRKKLQSFLNSSLGERVHQAAEKQTLQKEKAFVMGDRDADGDMILVQGIIDGFFEEDDGFVLYDYKTDRVSTEKELVDRYETQLLLYADAIERTHSKPVKEILIYSFALEKEVSIEKQSISISTFLGKNQD